ncbi:MAG TPA: helix-turn-helix domain-containing protein, partial [Candidatus Thermoplasmatota archaeon]|nr:helix-turn-helix domain-containing protein [Candidatus Thermoplasmatota archaeon]
MARRAPARPDAREAELLALGLSRYQAAAYAALATLGPAGPRQVADAARLPLARAYDALSDLAGLGLAAPVPARATTYRPLPVEGLVDRELARVRAVSASLAAERPAIESEFFAEMGPPDGFLLHPGSARFACAVRELVAAGSASAVLLWPSALAAFGGAAALATCRWSRLVLVASPVEARAASRLKWSTPPAILPPGAAEAERVVAGG